MRARNVSGLDNRHRRALGADNQRESDAARCPHPHDAIHVSRYDHGITSTGVPPAMTDIDGVTLRSCAHGGRCRVPAPTVQVPHLLVVRHIASCAVVTRVNWGGRRGTCVKRGGERCLPYPTAAALRWFSYVGSAKKCIR